MDPLKAALARKARDGTAGGAVARVVASGDGWRVKDVICTSGPGDRRFEEVHGLASISLVLSGTFVYRSAQGRAVMSPGSLMLGDPGRCFECGHEHGEGDRCLSFQFEPALFERLAHDAGVPGARFPRNHIPLVGALSPFLSRARAAAELGGPLEELAVELAGEVLRAANGGTPAPAATAADERRVSALLRFLEERLGEPHTLDGMASVAGLSRYHFLRIFKAVTGVTPHQWLLRARLREAAHRLVSTRVSVTEIALDVGFEDLSNFTRRFTAEFGASPRRFRAR